MVKKSYFGTVLKITSWEIYIIDLSQKAIYLSYNLSDLVVWNSLVIGGNIPPIVHPPVSSWERLKILGRTAAYSITVPMYRYFYNAVEDTKSQENSMQ